jgi:hypothetical protein
VLSLVVGVGVEAEKRSYYQDPSTALCRCEGSCRFSRGLLRDRQVSARHFTDTKGAVDNQKSAPCVVLRNSVVSSGL